MPINAFTKNGIRQPYTAAIGTIISGAIAEPIWDPMPTHVNERPVSFTGNQRDVTIKMLGYVPDSPTPKRKRIANNPIRPVANPVSAVHNDQNNTMRIKTARGPMRSPSMPEGISNNAYANEKDASTQPNC